MKLIKTADYDDMSRKAANLLSAQILMQENSVLGLATGSTVLGIYRQLIDWHKKGDLDFSQAASVNLDEYVGLDAKNPNSYRYYMQTHLFDHVNFSPGRCFLPDGMAPSPEEEALRYDALIEALGGIDMQLLGLGENGHIGFNEPGPVFLQGTHCVALSQSTIDANARFFDSAAQVPRQAITMGIKSILQARRVVLCVSGQRKAAILRDVLSGPVTPSVPGSILQLHGQLTVVADAAACCRLPAELCRP